MKPNKTTPFIFFGLLSFLILVFSYFNYSPKMPVSYWDEMQWVGYSYFFQFFINRDFDGKIWDTPTSKDQPMLAKYVMGAWLYPLYLKEKNARQEENFDYTKFLILNGFYFVDQDLQQYKDYYRVNRDKVVDIQYGEVGFTSDYLQKYGEEALKTVNTILFVRKLNCLLLAAAVFIAFLILILRKGFLFCVLFLFFYGFNSLIVNSGVRAHSEALFLLLFNLGLLTLTYYFLKGRVPKFLFSFSVFLGLCMSTKLNGPMLYFIYIVLSLFDLVLNLRTFGAIEWLVRLSLPLLLSLIVFVVLNPYTYPNPSRKIVEMFEHRISVVNFQTKLFPEDFMSNKKERFLQIFRNFFKEESTAYFNGLIFYGSGIAAGFVLFAFFIAGLASDLIQLLRGDRFSLIILSSFAVIVLCMVFYLSLNWDRYYVQLVFFIVYYQLVGFVFYLTLIKRLFLKISSFSYLSGYHFKEL